jgi:hypothetical protein
MSGLGPGSIFIAFVAAGCKYGPDDFARRVTDEEVVTLTPSPPSAPVPEGEKLYQLLYGDEFGPAARPLGQRVRILAWLHGLGLDSDQRDALARLAIEVQGAVHLDRVERDRLGEAELAAYSPIYTELIRGFTGERPLDAADLEAFSESLSAARLQVHVAGDPHRQAFERTKKILQLVQSWTNTLDKAQRERLADARFFLRRRLGPLVNPGHYEALVGTRWDEGDFNTLRYAARDVDEPAMDLGGLWRSEAYRVKPGMHLNAMQVQAIVAMAVTEPGFSATLQVAAGQRAPLDFAPMTSVPEDPDAR